MQYVGKVGGYVYNQWNSLNPSTLSGAIDIITVEQPDGSLQCSPWHVRFGKFQIIKPSQKKIDLYVNDVKTDLPMKLGDGGEAFFVFETDSKNGDLLSRSVLTSPVISPVSSPGSSPLGSPQTPSGTDYELGKDPEALDLNVAKPDSDGNGSQGLDPADIESKIKLSDSSPRTPSSPRSNTGTPTPSANSTNLHTQAFEKVKKITQKLNIPSKIDINGDIVLDMDGYKPNAQKNIDNSDELFKKIILKEIVESNQNAANKSSIGTDSDEFNDEFKGLWDQFISKDENGNIRILNTDKDGLMSASEDDLLNSDGLNGDSDDDQSMATAATSNTENPSGSDKTYFKTLRLTSEQLQKMNLHYGENTLKFKLSEGNSQIISNLYLWRSTTPIVISDIDGTITKSDALGHVLNLFGKDWTHPGVATLFKDIKANGYNIIYLTARSVGQADTTRQYLRGIIQGNGVKLPPGPVILSPDRTMAALRREVILKKPEVFKMACLNDIKSLYFHNPQGGDVDEEDDRTPFYAGFGNRITDAISYRSVKIPSHRIFTINPNGEVHMELLELAGYKSSYLHIGELVDQFFPPIKQVSSLDTYWNDNQFNEYMNNRDIDYTPDNSSGLGSPRSPGSPRSLNEEVFQDIQTDEKFNDVNYWREPPLNLSDLSDLDEEDSKPEAPKSPSLLSIRSFTSEKPVDYNTTKIPVSPESSDVRTRSRASSSLNDRPTSVSSFTSPLKNFMMFGSGSQKNQDFNDDDDYADFSLNDRAAKADSAYNIALDSVNKKLNAAANVSNDTTIGIEDSSHLESDYTEEEDLDDDDYTDDDYDEDEDEDYEDDYDEDEDDEDEEGDYEDDEELDEDDGIPDEEKGVTTSFRQDGTAAVNSNGGGTSNDEAKFISANDLNKLSLKDV
ncbi:uncharacterized protein RJT20DRAFT_130780 [Scheffersomyces xylosifermentans]|uniref:uncharacterized protein n=1 Tax=Scheffersomyces xylosifermentans TaxID=1304137 RepID=UPI00315D9C6C